MKQPHKDTSNIFVKSKVDNPFSIRRFRRNPTVKDVGKLAAKIWREPKFRVREGDNFTEFVFRLNFRIPDKVYKRNRVSHWVLFEQTNASWEEVLKLAYQQAFDFGKPIRNSINRLLHGVVTEALKQLLKNAGPSVGYIHGDFESIRQKARLKKRSKLNRINKEMAFLYRQIFPRMKELKKLVKDQSRVLSNEKLKVLIEKRFGDEWIRHVTRGEALQNLLEIPGHETTSSLTGSWTRRQLSVGIIVCMNKSRYPDSPLTPSQVAQRIQDGNKLMKRV